MKHNKTILALILFSMIFIMSSCAESSELNDCLTGATDGFWYGLLHGFICPFSFLWSIFDENTVIYSVNNNGAWYDLGYVIGLASIFGSSGRGTKKRK